MTTGKDHHPWTYNAHRLAKETMEKHEAEWKRTRQKNVSYWILMSISTIAVVLLFCFGIYSCTTEEGSKGSSYSAQSEEGEYSSNNPWY